ncbi:otoferlin isoform X3 [Spodoptera frugiperda]|nr:otoferlin isoform X3 [Spodoptera frugiperda]
MRTKSPEKRGRQKTSVQQTYRVEAERNPETTPQYFQISVNVLEARKLTWMNPNSANSYVIVVLGKKKHRTSIRRNMEEPYYREYFMFELYVSIRDIQRSSIWLAVMEPRCCAPPRLMGEASIDLGAIWSQPHHQVFHKWAQLSLPRNPSAGAVGFLKVDISIVFRGDIQVMPVVVHEDRVEDNLLLPTGAEQQPANYIITVYGAFGLPNGSHGQGDRRFGKLPSTFVRVSFCGLSAKTAVQARNNHPVYCEQISIVEMFPTMSEMIRLEVCSGDGCFNRVLGSAHLKLSQVSHDGENGFLPTFGPSLLHMYGATTSGTLAASGDDGPYHRGAMLVSLRTFVPYYQQGLRSTSVEPVSPLQPENLWLMEDFCMFCPILEVSMLDRRVSGKLCGIAITVGELPTDEQGDEEFVAMMSEIKQRKLYYTGSMDVLKTRPVHGYLDFENTFPVLQLAMRLPDFRFRMYRNNMVHGIVTDLEQTLNEVERRLKNSEFDSLRELTEDLSKAVDDAAGNILKFLDIIQYSGPSSSSDNTMMKYSTELDNKQLALQKEEIEKIYQQITKRTQRGSSLSFLQSLSRTDSINSTKRDVKFMLADIRQIAENLKSLIYKTSEGWPDIVVWLLNGGSRVAFYKMSIADIVYSVIPEQNGQHCGRIQNIYLRPLKCPKHMNTMATGCCCIAGKVELILWMGLYRQIHAFEGCLPKGYKLKVKDFDMCLKTSTMMLECRVFVYRAKLNTSVDINNHAHPFVRINTLNSVKESKVQQQTLTPIWNQVLKIHKLVSATHDRIQNSPPLVMVEVLDSDQLGKSELIGRLQVQPVVDERQDYLYAPKLQWYDLFKGAEYSGQILMSVQLCQIPETLMKNTVYSPVEETYVATGVKMPETESEEPEPLPPNLIPKATTYKVDIYWWGLRDVTTTRKPCVVLEIDELTIKSDVVCDKKSNCNFPNGRSSQTFQAPLNEVYCPPLSIRLYDSSTFGRTLFLGTNIVKNPNKYIVTWLPQGERDASLKSVSITASSFFQVSQILYVKKSSAPSSVDLGSKLSLQSIRETKRSRWKRVFRSKEVDEEEYVLLPMFSKENNQSKLLKNISSENPEHKDWWMRYYATIEDNMDDHTLPTDKIVIYGGELEAQPEFGKFKDWCTTLKLYNGKKTGIPEKDDQLYCGFLKAGIAIYRWPPPADTVAVSYNGVDLSNGYFTDYPNNEPSKFLVRVYVVKGVNLVAKAFSGKLDPYVAISCGSKHLGDRKNHVKNTLNPIFGKMYEFRCTLPDDYLLTVSLYDYDAVPPDELIGSTTIDLEDRIYSKHRARVGLPPEYNAIGPNKWRDCQKPSVILEDLCAKNHLDPPIFPDNATVVVNGVEYRDNDNGRTYRTASDRRENICLSLLHSWHTLPICGYRLVPEHVESRSLINSAKNGLEQVTKGKLQMWVDIFPLDADTYIPPGVDITPRKLEEYELRVIIWDVQGLRLDDHGKKVSDIYVRAWIDTIEQAQYTDVHYSSSSGEGSFNWRMIFHFQFHHAEKKLVRKEKGPFTEVEEHMTPIFVVQVLDSDALSQDDFLASVSFNLNSMTKGMKQPNKCVLEEWDKNKKINLFTTTTIRGWWPLVYTNRNTGMTIAAGSIDLEMTLLPRDRAVLMPVGLGREPPAPLPEPTRSESSGRPLDFVKSLKFGNWKKEHKVAAGTAAAITVVALLGYLQVPMLLFDFMT